jgi:hypothetical protein
MENRIDKIAAKSEIIFKYIAIVYLFVGLFYFMNLPKSSGDEGVFIADLHLIYDAGWYEAIVKNISIPYMLLVYPLSFILEDYIALRIVNIGLVIMLLLYFYYVSKIKFNSFYSYLLFFISTVGYFYYGTNDCLLFVSLIVFFNEVNRALNKKDVNFNLALTALVIAFFTRELFLVYLPVVFLGLYILYKSGYKFSFKTLFPLGFVVLFIILNIPSLEKKGCLSYDRKTPPSQFTVSWTQRTYLSQIMVNKGELENWHHTSWEVTQEYLNKNGKESLPEGIIDNITFDWKLTINEFFKDFATTIVNSFRSLGFMLLLSMLYWFHQSKKNKIIDFNYFVPFSTLVMMMIFSFIIICFPDLRWLSPVFVMTLVYYSELHEQKKISKYFILANTLILCLFSVYGIIRIFNKI